MKCYDWATEMRDKGVCVMGGFQSPLERDVLTFLLKGKQPVVWVLAHKLWTLWGQSPEKRTPAWVSRLLRRVRVHSARWCPNAAIWLWPS